jgi:subtilisin family serine protease
MKHLLFIALSFLSIQGVSAQEKDLPKLSPRTQQYLLTAAKLNTEKPLPDYVYKRTTRGTYMSAVIKVGKGVDQAALDALGVHIGTRAGSIWTALIPMPQVAAFTQVRGIEYIELDEPVCVNLDSARRSTRADSVQQGIGLPMPYTGKDVVVGIIDVGFDYTHPSFLDTTGMRCRIKRVWEEKALGTPPSGFIYGRELTDSAMMSTAHTDNNVNSHGTHVTGIAAGSGYGSGATDNTKYRGMAFESDIVMVGIMPDSGQWQNTGISDFIDGMNYIYTYAQSVGKPAVINLSWGSPVGPRDGNSLFSQACDALTGPGKIFVCAAGNDGDVKLHVQKTFTPTDTLVNTYVNFNGGLPTKNTWLDIWGDTAQQFCVQVSIYNGGQQVDYTGFICLDNAIHNFYLLGANGDTCFVTMTTSTSEFNGKPRIYLSIYSRVYEEVMLSLQGIAGKVDVWNGYVRDGHGYFGSLTNGNHPWAITGNADYTTTDMVATHSAISAGAYSARISYRNISGAVLSYGGYTSLGKLVPFSSHGPTADGRIKPDITAPGLAVVSAVNSFDAAYRPAGADYSSVISTYRDSAQHKNYYYGEMSGTSMATPATSGIIALMLQANPYLDPYQVRSILARTAILDTFTGQLPAAGTNTWGHGKINAYGAVVRSIQTVGISTLSSNNLSCKLYPNPNNGSFSIDYTASREQELSMTLTNITGQELYTDSWKVSSGPNSHSLSLPALAEGIYLARVSSAQGYTVVKMVVSR